MALSDRIRQRRDEKGISATELARLSDISKGYLSEIESGRASRPSADVLFRIAEVLGTTIGDLLEREVSQPSAKVPPALKEFAATFKLPDQDVQMLASIRFRGQQPATEDDWRYLYESIRRTIGGGG